MCIIVYTPEGVDLPSEKTLKQCYNKNPDGVGIMYRIDQSNIQITKGFMKYEDFKTALDGICREVDVTDIEVAIHFRFATHGSIIKELCHPFIVEESLETMRATNAVVKGALMHNGVICNYAPRGMVGQVSDTMVFVAQNHCNLREGIKMENGNKFCLMDGEGTTLSGDFVKENGVYYSNSGFRIPPRIKRQRYSGQSPSANTSKKGRPIFGFTTKASEAPSAKFMSDEDLLYCDDYKGWEFGLCNDCIGRENAMNNGALGKQCLFNDYYD